jgi:hypothetical protein
VRQLTTALRLAAESGVALPLEDQAVLYARWVRLLKAAQELAGDANLDKAAESLRLVIGVRAEPTSSQTPENEVRVGDFDLILPTTPLTGVPRIV